MDGGYAGYIKQIKAGGYDKTAMIRSIMKDTNLSSEEKQKLHK
ncbi:hypothetical protein KIPB_014497, partial [Kipferlia bialata]|eukprot:g14497.t1